MNINKFYKLIDHILYQEQDDKMKYEKWLLLKKEIKESPKHPEKISRLLNIIRNKFDQNKINSLHRAYKLIFRSSNNPTNIKELENLCKDCEEVSSLVNFVEQSERGVIQSSKQD